jgi:hypothetical protein
VNAQISLFWTRVLRWGWRMRVSLNAANHLPDRDLS